ncbi:MAG TPA: MFS transporter [Intrasporangium sp.]|uniref:MFS transporter n=1 Tax=Intrasporangium sp. TaxID=1925024 RepID=UPI002D79716D|nr:MFS transporter [Intrasporangium sp.]HET7396964.1 MFS transporter [Intrasporangium sp.]
MTFIATTARQPEPAGHQSRTKTIVGTGVGNALEWFDWGVFAIFAPFFATQFFNPKNPVSAFLSTLVVFAVGFAARPLGGFLFGWLADHRGRKFAMAATVAASAVGSLAIGVAPTYGSVGVLASAVLVVARLVQGLAHGGELPSAQTYVSEFAPRQSRGLWSSLIYVSGTLGNVVGVLVGAILSTVLTKADMQSFGWRIPFLIGGLFGLYALVMRARLHETEQFTQTVAKPKARPRVWPEIVRHRRQAIQVIGMTVGMTVAFYTWAIAAPAHAIAALGINAKHALWAGVAANLVFIAVLPLWGALSDRIGRRPVLVIGVLGTALVSFPLNAYLKDSAVQLLVSMSVALVFIAACAAIVPAVYAELFPTHIRTIGVGIPYSICVALFGGTAPYLQAWLGTSVGPSAFTTYVVVLLLVSVAVVLTVPETRGRDLDDPVLDVRGLDADPVSATTV